MRSALEAHRALYDAVESGDADMMAALWCDSADAVCIHPGALPVYGGDRVVRSWTALMAAADYLQFFLTDVRELPVGDDVVVVTCTENILAGASLEAFTSGLVTSTSVLRRVGDRWRFWARHASPILDGNDD